MQLSLMKNKDPEDDERRDSPWVKMKVRNKEIVFVVSLFLLFQ